MPPIVVIGAGILGASIAFHLTEQGADVILLDRAEPGQGATLASFAWLNANNKPPRAYHDLNASSMAEYPRLAARLAPAAWYHPDGNLVWHSGPDNTANLHAQIERLNAWGYPAELLSRDAVLNDLEPGLAGGVAGEVDAFGWFPGEGWVDATALTLALVAAVRAAGGQVLTGAGFEIDAIEMADDRVGAIALRDGSRFPVVAVVNAGGIAAPQIAELVGRTLPMVSGPAAFLVAETPDGGNPLRVSFDADGFELRPDGPGRVKMAYDYQPAPDTKGAPLIWLPLDHPAIVEGMRRAAAYVPALAAAKPVEGGIAIRPIPADGYSCAGAVADIPGYFECVTHSGATLAPLLGRVLAGEVLGAPVDPLLASFRPERFARSTADVS